MKDIAYHGGHYVLVVSFKVYTPPCTLVCYLITVFNLMFLSWQVYLSCILAKLR